MCIRCLDYDSDDQDIVLIPFESDSEIEYTLDYGKVDFIDIVSVQYEQ